MNFEKLVSVIIPTLNEEEGIEEVIEDIPEEGLKRLGYETEILVVDGGSSDETVEKVKEKGVDVFQAGEGKAEGVRLGFKEAQGDYVFLIDGDGSYPGEKIIDMVNELENGCDMVLGSRFAGEIQQGAMTTKNKIGNKILTFLANRLYGTDVSDLCTGLRGMDRNVLENNKVPGRGFEIEAGIHTVFSHENISEIGIRYDKRKGTSKLKTVDGLKIAGRLFKGKFKKR